MRFRMILIGLLFLVGLSSFSQVVRSKIGAISSPKTEVQLKLVKKIQNYSSNLHEPGNTHDNSIYSPKSVIFLKNGKMYVNSLEGFSTSVYKTDTWERLSIIKHKFDGDSAILKHDIPFNYKFDSDFKSINNFSGKPVEFTTSSGGKFLWVSYYRRSFDKNATQPSGLALIDTSIDKIIALFPTGPLPKMLVASDSSHKLAITHWGDNTVGILNINGDNPDDYKYEKHLIVGKKLELSYGNGEKINRDKNCGYCLRGTVFSEDGRLLFVGRMGGDGKIDVFRTSDFGHLGYIDNSKNNVRHLVIRDNILYISTNITGYVQKASLENIDEKFVASKSISLEWTSAYVGKGVRTISVSKEGKYVFAAVNNESKIVILDGRTLDILGTISTDSYPVGMDISEDNKWLAVTSQGKSGKGGHSVSIFEIIISEI